MATYTIYSDAADGYLDSRNGTYSTARSGGGTLSAYTSNTAMALGQGYDTKNSVYIVYEAFVSFDTSSVSGTVSTATLSLYCNSDLSTTDFTINARAYDWGSSLTTADWVAGADLSGKSLRASKTTAGISTSAYTGLTSDSSFASNTANPVRLILCSSRTESGTASAVDGTGENVSLASADYTGTDRDPKLVIVTAEPPVFAIMAPPIPAERQD